MKVVLKMNGRFCKYTIVLKKFHLIWNDWLFAQNYIIKYLVFALKQGNLQYLLLVNVVIKHRLT
ncbi:hypothetical protein B1J93_02825 [Leptospira kirschneri serovar Pomona]|uniref:Uncharacterized protein n=1 Tax=Leptospira kirschneri serovar Pomona TaxID=561005 RepID=A0A1T1E146_9LEPT|nr:hypothetical protein AYB32_07930 [Leptospira kirschneri]KXZ34123.1 hypothetical protein AYB34_09175 [Leptospira sp. ZV016]OOV46811.1 hypothetical protein B1J93_02825 [Leptospira kirschneri serovar Pomona]